MKKKIKKGKITAILLLVFAVSMLSGCTDKIPVPDFLKKPLESLISSESTTESTQADIMTEKTTEKETHTDKTTAEHTEESTTEQQHVSETEKPTEPQTTDAYTEKEETVYAKRDVNIRKGPSTDYDKVGVLSMGESATRIAVGDNGWSKINYDGSVCYVSTSYLTTEKPEEIKRTVVYPDNDNKLLIVVNAYREYDRSYTPKLKKISGYDISMDCDAADAFSEMYAAAKKDGITLYPISGYRTYEHQEKNYKNRIALWQSRGYSYNESVQRTREVILPPGTSEHNLGLAMDIGKLSNDFDKTKEYAWLDENAAKYGFILRYKAEWYEQTGVTAEPWHWRYVGKENAPKIKESGLCLEEYLGIER